MEGFSAGMIMANHLAIMGPGIWKVKGLRRIRGFSARKKCLHFRRISDIIVTPYYSGRKFVIGRRIAECA